MRVNVTESMGAAKLRGLTGVLAACVALGCGSDGSADRNEPEADAQGTGGNPSEAGKIDGGGDTDAGSTSNDATAPEDAVSPLPDAAPDVLADASGGGPDALVMDASPDSSDSNTDPSPCAECSGACLPDGGCAECLTDEHCPSAERCHPTLQQCVACLGGPTDNCPANQYCETSLFQCQDGCKDNAACSTGICTAEHVCVECEQSPVDTCSVGEFCTADFSCVPGCKPSGEGCASDRCGEARDCEQCLQDSECADGRLCTSGLCHSECSTATECPSTWSCCGTRCADTSRDFRYCGSCDNACSGEEFCTGAACLATTVSALCSVGQVTFLLDGLSGDDTLAADVLNAMASTCPGTQTQEAVSQETAITINHTTGRPVIGSGMLTVVLGGSFGQSLVGYFETEGISRVYSTWDATHARFHGRSTNGGADPILVEAPLSELGDSHSYFLIESIVDPDSHSWVVEIYGLGIEGTVAAAWFVEHEVLANLGSYPDRYYVYEWTDQDASMSPTSADTFTVIASGG